MLKEIKCCPVEVALRHIGKKWSMNIIRDLLMGKKRFKDFLESNKGISTKMLSQRLKELEKDGIIEKKITQKTPLHIEYSITQKGKDLGNVLFEIAMFSYKHYPSELIKEGTKIDKARFEKWVKESFGID